MSRKIKRPRCYFGCRKPAKYPPENPRWCSQRCAAEWAVEITAGDGMIWNPVHSTWLAEGMHGYEDTEEP